jgi:hypothetical protein
MMLGRIQFQNDKDLINKEKVDIVMRLDKEVTKREKQTRKQTLFTGTAQELLGAIQ